MSLYRLLQNLKLGPSEFVFQEFVNRDLERLRNAMRQVGTNVQWRFRRLRKLKEYRKKALQKSKWGSGYKKGTFGVETTKKTKGMS